MTGPIKQDTEPHLTVPAFLMQLDFPKTASVKDYLRTVNFETGEMKVHWTRRARRLGSSNVHFPARQRCGSVAHRAGGSVGECPDLIAEVRRVEHGFRDGLGQPRWNQRHRARPGSVRSIGNLRRKLAPKGVEASDVRQDSNEQRLIYKCLLDPSVDNSGYAGVVRVVRNGGSARMDGDTLVIENASSVMLLTRIEYFPDYSEDKVESLRQAVEGVPADYSALLERHRRSSRRCSTASLWISAAPRNMACPPRSFWPISGRGRTTRPRCWRRFSKWAAIGSSSTAASIPASQPRSTATIDLQTAGAAQGDLREGMEAYFNWMESLAPDCRANAKNIFGFRGASYPLFPDKGIGVNFYYTSSSGIGIWPYWISAGGWCAAPVLGALPGHRRPGISAQSRRAGL